MVPNAHARGKRGLTRTLRRRWARPSNSLLGPFPLLPSHSGMRRTLDIYLPICCWLEIIGGARFLPASSPHERPPPTTGQVLPVADSPSMNWFWWALWKSLPSGDDQRQGGPYPTWRAPLPTNVHVLPCVRLLYDGVVSFAGRHGFYFPIPTSLPAASRILGVSLACTLGSAVRMLQNFWPDGLRDTRPCLFARLASKVPANIPVSTCQNQDSNSLHASF